MAILSAVILSLMIMNYNYFVANQECLQVESVRKVEVTDGGEVRGELSVCDETSTSGVKGFEWGMALVDLNDRFGELEIRDWGLDSGILLRVEREDPYKFEFDDKSLVLGKDLFWAKSQATWALAYVYMSKLHSPFLAGLFVDQLLVVNDLYQIKDPRTFSVIKWPSFTFVNSVLSDREFCSSPWVYSFQYSGECPEEEVLTVKGLRLFWVDFWSLVVRSLDGQEISYFKEILTPGFFQAISVPDQKEFKNYLEAWLFFKELTKAIEVRISEMDHRLPGLAKTIEKKIELALDILSRSISKSGDLNIDEVILNSSQDSLRMWFSLQEKVPGTVLDASRVLFWQNKWYPFRRYLEIPERWLEKRSFRRAFYFGCEEFDLTPFKSVLSISKKVFWVRVCDNKVLKSGFFPNKPGWQKSGAYELISFEGKELAKKEGALSWEEVTKDPKAFGDGTVVY
jgi:hypothetical protein